MWELVFAAVMNQQRDKGEQEVEIVARRWQAKWVDAEALRLQPDLQVGAAEHLRQASIGAPHVEDEGIRVVLL